MQSLPAIPSSILHDARPSLLRRRARLLSWHGLVALLASVLTWLTLPVGPASALAACACATELDVSSIDGAPTAFEGTVMARAGDVWTIRISEDPKNNLPDEIAIQAQEINGDNCGVIWQPGRMVATLAEPTAEGYLWTSGCGEVSPDLLKSWEPPQGITGRIPDLVVGGAWGAYRTVAFDGPDRVAFGYEPGRVVALAACPDEQVVAELAVVESASATEVELALRSIDNFEVADSVVLAQLDDGPAEVERSWAVSCSAADGSDVSAGFSADGHTEAWAISREGDSLHAMAVTDDVDLDFSMRGVPTEGDLPAGWPSLAFNASSLLALDAAPALKTVPPAPVPATLALTSPPPPEGWSPWLLVLIGAVGLLYLARNIGKKEWRTAWSRPSGSQNYDARLDQHQQKNWFDRFR